MVVMVAGRFTIMKLYIIKIGMVTLLQAPMMLPLYLSWKDPQT